jgi:hypothetical protein
MFNTSASVERGHGSRWIFLCVDTRGRGLIAKMGGGRLVWICGLTNYYGIMETKVLVLLLFPSKEVLWHNWNIGPHLCCGLFYIAALSDYIAQMVKTDECWFGNNLEEAEMEHSKCYFGNWVEELRRIAIKPTGINVFLASIRTWELPNKSTRL